MNAKALENLAAAIPGIFAALLAIVCVAGLWRVFATIGLRVPFDPNEGWNAYHATAAMAGRALYPDSHSYMVNNYPPLSFYIVGAAGRLIGDSIVAGRIIALVSFFAVATVIAMTVRIMGGRAIDAAIAALLFVTFLLVGSDYVGMDDPQLLGHAFGMAGLILVLRERRRYALVAGALLFVLALFVKHNLVALPLALSAWLLFYDRRAAWQFIGWGLAFSLAGLLAFRFAFGSNLLSHLASSRSYSLALLESGAGLWLVWGAVPLAITGALFAFYGGDRRVVFCALFAGLALSLGFAFAGGAGVDANAFFDADIALTIGCGLAFNRFAARGVLWPAVISLVLVPPLVAGIYIAADEDWRDPDFWFHPMADDAALTRGDIAFLARHHGRAMCEMLSLCYWAGKSAEVDMFNAEQQFLTGARRDDDLARRIEAHAFAAVQLDTLDPFALTPRLRASLLGAYRIDHVDDNGVFLVPR
jgi:hypothetical protein